MPLTETIGRDGVCRVQVTAPVTPEHIREHFARLDGWADSVRSPVATIIVFEPGVLSDMTIKHRQTVIDGLKNLEQKLGSHYIAQAIVTTSPIVRAMMTAVWWFVKAARHARTFDNADDALRWCEAEVAKASQGDVARR